MMLGCGLLFLPNFVITSTIHPNIQFQLLASIKKAM